MITGMSSRKVQAQERAFNQVICQDLCCSEITSLNSSLERIVASSLIKLCEFSSFDGLELILLCT